MSVGGKYITAYTGGTILSGFTNVGNIAIDTNPGSGDYSIGNFIGGILDTYDSSGYVIITDTTNAGVVGRPTGNNSGLMSQTNQPTFWVSPTKDDDSFLFLVNRLPARSGLTPFTSALEASTWLVSNGYWTTYNTPVLYLDANNTSSYSGTGTTWYDISGNGNDVDMVNAGSISWTSGIGYFTTGSDGWFSKTSGVNIPTGNSNYTLSSWVQLGTAWGSQGIISVGSFGSSNQANALRTGSTNQIINYWWANDFVANSSVSPTDSWFNVVAKFDGTTRSIFINGALIGSDGPTGHDVTTSDIQIAKTLGSEYLNGNIAQAMIYNVALSDADILSSFNSTKSRFGL